MTRIGIQYLAAAASVLAFAVVVLGAFVRLTDAGLGCPDWPGCYGQIGVPESGSVPGDYERPLERGKAWKEMIHRYFAGTLGLVIAVLGFWAWRRRHQPGESATLPLFLVALVVFQAALGMWTVTLLLKPLVVTAHLLGGMATLALLWWVALRRGGWWLSAREASPAWRKAALIALVVVIAQIALGGWTSANYAALACPEFPACYQGQWWPPTNFGEAFTLWHGLGIDYEGGVLTHPARTAIHLTHRLGAVVTLLVVGTVAVALMRARTGRPTVRMGGALALLVLAQVGLGIANVIFGLPLAVAVAHNALAAALLVALVTLNHMLRPVGPAA
ncbi:COX15/CtaA family protein [Thiohalorhabdus sp.]|uniref:COX15/CtaA family protein n=1 Tax=Thiohalorhabdus sp. TaxID=3094134 RepID=UPI002FC3B627